MVPCSRYKGRQSGGFIEPFLKPSLLGLIFIAPLLEVLPKLSHGIPHDHKMINIETTFFFKAAHKPYSLRNSRSSSLLFCKTISDSEVRDFSNREMEFRGPPGLRLWLTGGGPVGFPVSVEQFLFLFPWPPLLFPTARPSLPWKGLISGYLRTDGFEAPFLNIFLVLLSEGGWKSVIDQTISPVWENTCQVSCLGMWGLPETLACRARRVRVMNNAKPW